MNETHPFHGSQLHSALIEKIQADPNPLEHDASFNEFALKVFEFQFHTNPPYQKLCSHRGLHPRAVEHWTHIPAVPTSTFKDFDWSCIPPSERTAVFHSSGTTVQRPSRHHHSPASLQLYRCSLLEGFLRLPWVQSRERLRNLRPVFLFLTPPVEQVPHSSLVHMFQSFGENLDCASGGFAGATNALGEWVVETARVVETCRRAAVESRPVWIFGTAFNWVHLLDSLNAEGITIPLPQGSVALETGGYKGRSRVLSRQELHGSIRETFKLAADQLVSEYGMSELSSQGYTRLGDGRACYSFPPWARVRIMNPENGREAEIGKTGVVQLLDLANLYSVSGIVTEDLAIRRDEGFEWCGRVTNAEPRGCSIQSASQP